jgi:hypothetical protein
VALVISRDHLGQFLQREAFADNIVQLFGELELQQMLNQFFDRAMYYGILGYNEAWDRDSAQGSYRRYDGSRRTGRINSREEPLAEPTPAA